MPRAPFREQARAAAERDELDEAIRLYLAALRETPADSTLHDELRRVSCERKSTGGQSLGLIDKLRGGLSHTLTRRLLDASRQLAYDPADTAAMRELIHSAQAAGFAEVADWATKILSRMTANL